MDDDDVKIASSIGKDYDIDDPFYKSKREEKDKQRLEIMKRESFDVADRILDNLPANSQGFASG